ncbi:ATP-binding protein [Verrucomicrobium sp. GAS474]|uniref:hybrid sensor histidine kinase/response regulator n=1 Tax=Verrucomicrobium sp. GAS474 TaxID=1882831 RepID=UPI00138FB297|nr:ATP-binding protein [Verrucomicrobium sp. GAS474]
MIEITLEQACQLVGAVHGSFIQVDHRNGFLDITSTYGEDWTEDKKNCHLGIGYGITGTVAATGKPYFCADTTQDPTYVSLFSYVKSEMAVPVKVRGEVWGVINMDGFEPNAFSESDLTTVSLFADLVAFAFSLEEEYDERKRLLEEAMEGQKLEAVVKVIAGIAHEINNPLTTVLGQASILEMTPDQPPAASSLRAISSETRRAARILRSLLHFARREVSAKQVVNVASIVRELFSLREYQLRVHNIELTFRDAQPPAAVEANPDQVLQVLMNLVNNAERAIPPERKDGKIAILAERAGRFLLIRVADNGEGIPEENSEKVFRPFFTTKEKAGSVGLGLPVAQTLMEAHGGKLYLSTSSAAGSCFVLEFPAALPAIPEGDVDGDGEIGAGSAASIPAPTPSKTARNLKPGSVGRVLVVDDEPAILEFLERFLTMQKVEVVTGGNGIEGLERLAADGDFDVVLSDIKMPRCNGIDFYSQACVDFPSYKGRFLFMSGDFISATIHEFHQKTGCHILEKPFKIGKLKELIFSFFNNAAPPPPPSPTA